MTSHYGASYYIDEMAMPDAAYAMVSRLRAEKIQPHIRPSDKVLEFGVGSGLNLASLSCAARYGSDINPSSNEVAFQHGIELIDPAKSSDGSYDAIICHHVLEHVSAPAEILTSFRRLLRPGGKLLLFVPYDKHRRFRSHIAEDENHHLYSWTPHTLANLVIESGFKLQTAMLGTFGYDRIAARLAVGLHLGDFGFRLLRQCAHLLRREREVRVFATC